MKQKDVNAWLTTTYEKPAFLAIPSDDLPLNAQFGIKRTKTKAVYGFKLKTGFRALDKENGDARVLTLNAALKHAPDSYTRIQTGIAPRQKEAQRLTIDALFRAWMRETVPEKSQAIYMPLWEKHWSPQNKRYDADGKLIGTFPKAGSVGALIAIEQDYQTIDAAIKRVAAKCKNANALRRGVKWISRAYAWGVNKKGLVTLNGQPIRVPSSYEEAVGENNVIEAKPTRQGFISPADLRTLYARLMQRDGEQVAKRYTAATVGGTITTNPIGQGEAHAAECDALAWILLTITRKNETLAMQWGELDDLRQNWIIPGERTKTRKEHTIPLSAPMREILARREQHRKGDYVFHHGDGLLIQTGRLNQLLKRLGVTAELRIGGKMKGTGCATVHDCRRSGSDLLTGVYKCNPIAVECMQAHAAKVPGTSGSFNEYNRPEIIFKEDIIAGWKVLTDHLTGAEQTQQVISA